MIKENANRDTILHLLKIRGQMNISQIVEELKISRPVVYLHLKTLEKEGLISKSKNMKKKGAPVTISIKEGNVKTKDLTKLIDFLNIIKKKGEIDLLELKKEFNNNWINLHPLQTAQFLGYIGKKIYITEEGKRFLNKHENENGNRK